MRQEVHEKYHQILDILRDNDMELFDSRTEVDEHGLHYYLEIGIDENRFTLVTYAPFDILDAMDQAIYELEQSGKSISQFL